MNIDPKRSEDHGKDPRHPPGPLLEPLRWTHPDIAKNEPESIEDCAHAIETEYQGRKAGTFGDFGCFSFYVTKNIVTGEGGMVLARREEDIARVKILGLHGMSKDAWKRFSDEGYNHYKVVECGFKYNMMDLRLPSAPSTGADRSVLETWEIIWKRYNEAFADLVLYRDPAPNTRHAYHQHNPG
jgi:dTDP-4-amino-4,6-dideoxygalactose transaminase